MNGKNLKGLAIDKETIIVFAIVFMVFVIMITFLLKTEEGTGDIYTDMEIRTECSKWMMEEIPCSGEVENYPALDATFNSDKNKAKEFCNCPK